MKTKRTNNNNQATAFRKAARELGCDVSDDQFKETLRKIAKPRLAAPKARPRSK